MSAIRLGLGALLVLFCLPSTADAQPTPTCGDYSCDAGEDEYSCPDDCGYPSYCGDYSCDGDEDESSCPEDCGYPSYCGDYSCDGDEDEWSCPEDCGTPSYCGDYSCDGDEDEWSCPEDCGTPSYCGDYVCDGDEDEYSCPEDCGMPSYCGDYVCDADEDQYSCPDDCGYPGTCGDGICDPSLGEDEWSCPEDCGYPGYCGDGVCDPALGEDEWSCPDDCYVPEDVDGDGYTVADGDCDDNDPNRHPGAQEVCDDQFTDEDCDYLIDDFDDSVQGQTTWYRDADGDLHGVPDETQYTCHQEPGWAATDDDCDDADPNRNPSALEFCDPADLDEDCDYGADDQDPDGAFGTQRYWQDSDGDGFGDENGQGHDLCDPPAGWVANNDDCNDGDAAIHPAAAEVCDPGDADENCNGTADSNDPTVTDALDWYDDSDNDNYGDPATHELACEAPDPDMVNNGDDCDDTRASVRPTAHERCDGIDNDCDGLVDDADNDVRGAPTWGVDDDGDGWTPPNPTEDACLPPNGFVPHDGGDCDDADPSRNPSQIEICDGFDNDCTFIADDLDLDGDGHWACTTDCDDLDPTVNPSAAEVCDAADRDCDGDPGLGLCLAEAGDGDVDVDFGLPLGACAGGSTTLSAVDLLAGPVLTFDTDVVVPSGGLAAGTLLVVTPCTISVDGPLSGASLGLVAGERVYVGSDLVADTVVLRAGDRVQVRGSGWVDAGSLAAEAPSVRLYGDVDGATLIAAEAGSVIQGSSSTVATPAELHLDADSVTLSGLVTGPSQATVVTTGAVSLQGASSLETLGTLEIVAGGKLKAKGQIAAAGAVLATASGGAFPGAASIDDVDDLDVDFAGNVGAWRGDVTNCGQVAIAANKLRVRADASFVANDAVELAGDALVRIEGDFEGNGDVLIVGDPYRLYGSAAFNDNGACTLQGPAHRYSVPVPECVAVP